MARSSRTGTPRALRQPPRSTRRQPVISYAESPTDSELDLEDSETDDADEKSDSDASDTPLAKRRRTSRSTNTRSSTRQTRSTAPQHDVAESSISRSMNKKRKHPRPSSSKTTLLQHIPGTLIEDSGNIPPWQTLPYAILVQIFEYATYPLYEERTFQPTASLKWLLDVAGLCRTFAEPAFTVLYASPPLVPMDKAHR